MGKSTKAQSAPWGNTAGQRSGMKKGNAPAAGRSSGSERGHVHDSGFSYAEWAKSDPGTYGQGKGKGNK